jgi:hypothetical protein
MRPIPRVSLTFAQVVWTGLALLLACSGAWCVVRGGWRWRTGNVKPCPKCAYDLANAAADESGLVFCPECGGKTPTRKIVARRARRWSLVVFGAVLLLVAEPTWRVQHVSQPDGTRNWMALVPNWVLALVWPIPNPLDSEMSMPTRVFRNGAWQTAGPTARWGVGGRTELDARLAALTTDQSRRHIWGSIYARRLALLWDGVMTPPDAAGSTPGRVRIFTMDRIFADAGGERAWMDTLRDVLHVRYRHEQDAAVVPTIAANTAEQTEEDAIKMMSGALQRTSRFTLGFGYTAYEGQLFGVEPLGGRLLVLSTYDTSPTLQAKWRAMNVFYAKAGPTHHEARLFTQDNVELRGYWIGDMCSEPTAETDGLPAWAFISTMNDWLRDQRLSDGYQQDWIVDPAGRVLMFEGDARMHELVRLFIASQRETK